MKKSLSFAFAAFMAGLLVFPAEGAMPVFRPYAVSPRRIVIGKTPKLTLVKDGKINFEVVKPVNGAAGPAAAELTGRLSQITGQKVAVVPKASGRGPAFYLGVCPESKAAGLEPEKLDRDGFFIKTAGNKIFITGVDTNKAGEQQWATLFGVYDFLERFAGVRYYFPHELGIIVPRKTQWTLPDIDITERPDTQYRQVYTYGSLDSGAKARFPGQKETHPKFWRNSSLHSIRSCHGLNDLELARRFRKSNPEIFALTPEGRRRDGTDNTISYQRMGHLCYSSEKLLEIVCQDAEACLTGKPASSRGLARWASRWNTQHINITPNDGLLWCQCTRCKKIQEQGEKAMGEHIWRFFINVANYLKKKNIPGTVVVDSYGIYKNVPAAQIPDNMVVQVCVSGAWGMSREKVRADQDKRIREWFERMKSKVDTWTYATKASCAIPLVPNFTPRAVAAFYNSQKERIFGGFLEAGSDRWMFGVLNYYVFAKLLWNFGADAEALIDEHCRLMYGKAAPVMNQFYLELERIWMQDILRGNVKDTPLGEIFVPPTRRDVWTKILSPAKIAEVNKLLDDAERTVKNDPEALKRVRFMREQLWGPVVEGAKTFARESADKGAWTLQAGKAEKITLDGKLDEPEWKKARPVFLLGSKWEKVPVHTRVRALYDREYLYFGIEADEPETEKIVALTTRRPDCNEIWMDSSLEIFLSAESASPFIYQFIVNAAGAKSDLRNTLTKVDEKYDSGFEVKTCVTPGKMYAAEFRIPLKAMPELQGRSKLVANFTRHRFLKGMTVKPEFFHWFPKTRNIAENCGNLLLDAPAPQNMIKTPDFDRKIVHKRFIGNGEWAGEKALFLDREVFLTAGSSLRLDASSPFIRQTLKLEPGKKYVLSFYLKTEELTPGFRGIIRFGGDPAPARYVLGNYKDYIRGTVNWHRVEKHFTAPEVFGKKHGIFLDFFVGKSKGKCWLDHVELREEK